MQGVEVEQYAGVLHQTLHLMQLIGGRSRPVLHQRHHKVLLFACKCLAASHVDASEERVSSVGGEGENGIKNIHLADHGRYK